MTVLENLLVAQHNTLMAATGFGVLAVLGLGRYRAAEAAGMEKARYWLDAIGLTAGRTIRPARCPTARSGGWKSPARCASTRCCCAWTNPPPG